MSGEGLRRRQVRWLALIVCALSLVVVGVSAYLRLEAAGVGCADWPACYGRILSGEPAPLHYGFARLLHRVAASSALLLTLLIVWRCCRPQPIRAAARPAILLLVLMLALSALGFFSADPRRALVAFLNIVGGLALVTFSWRVAMAAGSAQAQLAASLPGLQLRIGAAILSVAVALGAWLGATYSAVACPAIPICELAGWSTGDLGRALNPLVRLEAAPMPGDGAGATLHMLHRGMALLALMLLGGAVVRMRRPAGWAVLALLVATMLLGIASVTSDLSLWLVVGHGVAAALLLAAVATLLRR